MDRLGKVVYENPYVAYKYKGKIVVPPLEMVDDILTISTCGAASVALNVMVNSFMSSKKLQLNKLKCAKIHIGRNYERCPALMVQGGVLKDSDKEKYFGDKIHKKSSMQQLWKDF